MSTAVLTTVIFLAAVVISIYWAWASRRPGGSKVFKLQSAISLINLAVFVYFLFTHYLGNEANSIWADLTSGIEAQMWAVDFVLVTFVFIVVFWNEAKRFGLPAPWKTTLATLFLGPGTATPLFFERLLAAEKTTKPRPAWNLYWLHSLMVFGCLFIWVPNFFEFDGDSLGKAYSTPVVAYVATTVILVFGEILTFTLPKTPTRYLQLGSITLNFFYIAGLSALFFAFRDWGYALQASAEDHQVEPLSRGEGPQARGADVHQETRKPAS